MNKKFKDLNHLLAIFFALVMIFTFTSNEVMADAYANSTSSKVLVNGIPINFEAYNIGGNNYFKIRDIAKVLSQTNSKFNVKWDSSKNAINLITAAEYEPVGGEMETSNIITVKIVKNTAPIYKNGQLINMSAYNIGGNNYFKLRDIGKEIGFDVGFDNKTKSVLINTSDRPSQLVPQVNKPEAERPLNPPINNSLSDLYEYELSIEYIYDKDIEYEYKISNGSNVKAKYENEITNEKLYGPEAERLIEGKLLNLDYSLARDQVIENVLNSLGVDKNYKEFELEIEYRNKPKLKIKNYR